VKIGLVFITAVILDQATKIIVKNTMTIGQSIKVIGDVIRFTHVRNPGIAFGIRVQNGFLFTLLSILASIGVMIYLFTHWHEKMSVKCSLALILGGAFGNLIDRILYKQVVDFIDIGFNNVRWPVFNIADSAVVIGMIILFYTVFITDKKKQKIGELESKQVE